MALSVTTLVALSDKSFYGYSVYNYIRHIVLIFRVYV